MFNFLKAVIFFPGDLSPSAQLGGFDDGRDSFSFTPSMIKFPTTEFGEVL